MPDRKLKILCIHGYRQSGQTFRQRTGALRKSLKKHAEFAFITAPNQIKSDEEEKQFGWWFSTNENSYDAHEYTDACVGLESSLQVVADSLEKEGPFDGILAFSQGASLLSIICSLKEKKDERFANFNFAVFVSGYKSRQSVHKCYYDVTVSVPSLHVMGETDKVIEKEMSVELSELYEDKTVLEHKGGHFVPATSAEKAKYVEFLSRFA